MTRTYEKWAVAEVGDMMGRPRQRIKPKRCKFKGCKTTLNSYHSGRYCHVHEHLFNEKT